MATKAAQTYRFLWREDGDATVLARVTARNASGTATGVAGEGKWIQQVDVDSITCKVFDKKSATPESELFTPSVTIASAILDTPDTSDELWTADATGYNFFHDLAGSNFPDPDREYVVEYEFTLVGGKKFILRVSGESEEVFSS